jgi:hypothetical protein
MQIGEKTIKNILVIMVLEKQIKKHNFPFLFAWESLSHIVVWNCANDNLWNVMLSY